MMMMISFITITSGLVPLIEGVCAQILYFRFEIIGGLRSLVDTSQLTLCRFILLTGWYKVLERGMHVNESFSQLGCNFVSWQTSNHRQ